MPPAPLTLSQLSVGESATISGYARGDRALRNRMMALGLTRGTPISLVRAGMTGCPIEVRARGTSLVLRRTEAAALHVERPSE
jgi:Fe2+ transport system protein FeoA